MSERLRSAGRGGDVRAVISWSGGKDSALALARAVESGVTPIGLLSMLDEDGQRSRSHGLPRRVLEAQADALGLPLVTRSTSWPGYTDAFVDGLRELAAVGAQRCVFGDIDIEDHRRWCERACRSAGMTALHPLWQVQRGRLLDEFLSRGFSATVVVVRRTRLDESHLGRTLDARLRAELKTAGIDACGENGEYHTVVTAGPLFRRPLALSGRRIHVIGDCAMLDVTVRGEPA